MLILRLSKAVRATLEMNYDTHRIHSALETFSSCSDSNTSALVTEERWTTSLCRNYMCIPYLPIPGVRVEGVFLIAGMQRKSYDQPIAPQAYLAAALARSKT